MIYYYIFTTFLLLLLYIYILNKPHQSWRNTLVKVKPYVKLSINKRHHSPVLLQQSYPNIFFTILNFFCFFSLSVSRSDSVCYKNGVDLEEGWWSWSLQQASWFCGFLLRSHCDYQHRQPLLCRALQEPGLWRRPISATHGDCRCRRAQAHAT